MSHHDVGRGRGGTRKALSTISARTTVVSVGTDRLFPSRLQVEIVHAIGSDVQFSGIDSQHGHDGFLVERLELSSILKEVLKP
jgi:homoserine O-acetyltransferase